MGVSFLSHGQWCSLVLRLTKCNYPGLVWAVGIPDLQEKTDRIKAISISLKSFVHSILRRLRSSLKERYLENQIDFQPRWGYINNISFIQEML